MNNLTSRVKVRHFMFAQNIAPFIRESCKPLNHLGLTNFMHDITFTKGQISMLVSDENVFSFYSQNKIPTLCTDETGRTLAEGIYINKILENTRRDCAILMPLLVKIGKQFDQNYGRNSLHIVVREDNCQHLYSLFFDREENDFLYFILNNGHLLNDFVDQYNFNAKDIILEAKSPENRLVLPTFESFSKSMKIDNSQIDFQIKVIHKNLHSPLYLSKQQSKCVVLLAQGKSAKEISIDMQLSHRTVEHYLDKIRKLLSCSSNKELIASYGDQLKYNYPIHDPMNFG